MKKLLLLIVILLGIGNIYAYSNIGEDSYPMAENRCNQEGGVLLSVNADSQTYYNFTSQGPSYIDHKESALQSIRCQDINTSMILWTINVN